MTMFVKKWRQKIMYMIICIIAICSFSSDSYAAHFRSGTISWRVVSGNTIEFKVSQSYGGWAFGGGYTLGSVQYMDNLLFGNGNYAPINLTITSINAAEGWWYGESTITYTYPTSGNYTAYFSSCCRISNLSNNANQNWRNETIVNVGGNNNSPVTTVPATINLPAGISAAAYQIPGFDPDGDALTYSLATSAEMGGGLNPSGLSINSTTGLMSFNTIGRPIGSLWNVAITIRDGKTKVTVDFIIKITQSSTPPYFDYLVTPSNGQVFQISPGQNINFIVRSKDNDPGSTVTTSAVGLPPFSSTNPALPTNGNPSQSTFSWTPTANQFGTYVINFTATDNIGVQASTSVTIVVSLKPVFNVPPTPASGSQTYLETNIANSTTITASDPDPNDVVQIISVVGLPSGASLSATLPTTAGNPTSLNLLWTPTSSNFGIHNVSFTAKDSYGDQANHSFKYLVNTKPSFTSTPITQAYVGQLYQYNITGIDPDVQYGDVLNLIGGNIPSWLTFTNNGNGIGTLTGTPTLADLGSYNVSLILEDTYHHDYNPHVDQDFVINVAGIAPQIACPANITVNNTAGQCGANVTFAATEATAIPASTITYSHAPGSFFPVGTTTITATATNAVGTSTCTFTVTVVDNEAPGNITISYPAPALALSNVPEAANYNLVYALNVPNAADFNTHSQVSYSINNAATLAATPFNRVAYLMDLGTKWVWVSFDKITSNLNEIGIPADYVKQQKVSNMNVFSSAGSGVTNGTNISTGNVEFWPNCYSQGAGNPNIPQGNNGLYDFNDVINSQSIDCYGSFQIHNYALAQTLFAYNRWAQSGNSDIGIGNQIGGSGHPDWTFAFNAPSYTVKKIYVLINGGGPALLNPTLVLNANGQASLAVNQVDPGVSDNCGVATSVLSKTNFDCTNLGTNTITLTVTDIHGNAYNGNATVTVVDNIAPVITCPSNINVFATSANGAVVNYTTPTATDNCNATVSLLSGLASGSTFPIGTSTVTYKATDAAGNTVNCSFTVTVTGIAPQIACPANITVNNTAGQCGANVTFAATETTAIPASTITYSHAPGSFFPVGTTTVTATATNAVGTSSCTFTVTVVDNEAPVLIGVPSNTTVECDAVPTAAAVTATDNCSTSAVNLTESSTQLADVNNAGHYNYVITRTWTVTDASGNSSSASQTITVQDQTAPVANCKPVTVTLVGGVASITSSDVNNGSTDNCNSPLSYSLSNTSFTCNNIGLNTVTLTVTDVSDNSSTCTAEVTVVGEIPTCSITSVPTNIAFTGGVSTNLYLGYGAQSTTLQVSAAASGAPYTYQWSGPAGLSSTTSGSPVFTATAEGTYTFTVLVTNKYGCTTTCSITICVLDIRAKDKKGNYNGKVYVCHVPPGNPGNAHTLEISVNAVPAHVGLHGGDRLGKCEQQICSNTTNTQYVDLDNNVLDKSTEDLSIKVSPNPSSNYFVIRIDSKQEGKIQVRVITASGQPIERKDGIQPGSSITLGSSWLGGRYYLEAIQGDKKKVVSLIKMN